MKNIRIQLALVGRVMTAVFLIIAVLGIFSNSYAKDKFGRLRYNPDIIPKFASSAPLPTDIDIYFSGPADRPYAVIGIAREVPFDPNIWRPISEEAGNINKWRLMIHDYNDMLARPYFGYDILDPDGKVIGKWISYQRDTVVKMTRDNKITVYTPDAQGRFDDDPQRIGR
jgi:hypothetical protein